MKKEFFSAISLLLFLLPFNLNSQSKIFLDLKNLESTGKYFDLPLVSTVISPLDENAQGLIKHGDACFFRLDETVSNTILNQKPKLIRLQLPYGDKGKIMTLLLFEKEIRSTHVKVTTSDGRTLQPQKAAFYRGIVEGEDNSLAGVSFFNNEISGIVSSDILGTFDIGKVYGKNVHTIYTAASLPIKPTFTCHTDESQGSVSEPGNELETRGTGECVRVWIETDYALYQNKGGITETENFISGLFNNVAILYDNESINTIIGRYYIWTTQDPYPIDNSGSALTLFRNTRTDLEGDAELAHLVALGGNNLGGVAYVDVLCSNSYFHAYSNIYTAYADFPNYSWDVMVLAHEMGHNIGSQHTQWCGWPGGAIDNCYQTEGGCPPGPPPVGGGTIMSYCHLTNFGINFTKGFGPLPGDKIRNKVQFANCLSPCPVDCPVYTVTGIIANVKCNGGQGGKIDLDNPSAGIPPFTFNWSNGMNSQNINNLIAGTYQVTVTDSELCTQTASFNVTQPTAMEYTASTGNILCYGGSDGFASIDISGGAPPYIYDWSNGVHSSYNSNLTAGSYGVTVTDAQGCILTKSFLITQPDKLIIIEDIGTVSCYNGSDEFVHTGTTGGVGSVSFIWNTGSINNNIDDLLSGNYSVTVMDGNGCSSSESYYVPQPDLLEVNIIKTDVTQLGGSDGTAKANLNGGTFPFIYSWSNGGISQMITGLPAGDYYVTVTDANGCTSVQSVTISEPDCALTGNIDKTDISCYGQDNGQATANASNNSGIVTYHWSNNATTQTIQNLTSGNYSVTISDGSCSVTKGTIIVQPSALVLSISGEPTGCNSGSGTATALVNGGTPNYQYIWSNGGTTKSISNLEAGTYSVTVTDSRSCTRSSTVTILAIDNQNPTPQPDYTPLVIDLDENGNFDLNSLDPNLFFRDNCGLVSISFADHIVDCKDLGLEFSTNGTGLDVSGNSATKSFGFIIKDNIPPTLACPEDIRQGQCQGIVLWPTVIPGDNCGTQPMKQIAGLPPGSIFPLGVTTNVFQVSDNSGNETTCSFTVTITEGLVMTLVNKNISCAGMRDGSAQVNTNNLTRPYTILWSTGDTSATITNLAAGTYTVTVLDGNGCSDINEFTITEPAPLSLKIVQVVDASGPAVSDGSIDVAVSGGTPVYTFEWTKDSQLIGNTEDISNLLPGSYELKIRDKNGCTLISAEVIVHSKTSANNQESVKYFTIYPNPANEVLYITGEKEFVRDLKVDGMDMMGRTLNLSIIKNVETLSIDTHHLISGTYYFRLTSGSSYFIQKVIILH